MTTITFLDTGDTLTFTSLNPPPLITILDPVPTLTFSQIPGVGPVGPQGTTGAQGAPGHSPIALSIPGPLSVMTGTMPYITPRPTIFHGIAVAVGEAPVGDDIVFDVLADGVTIFTTVGNRPRILDGAVEGATVFVPDVTSFAAGVVITVNVIQVGDPTPGSDGVLVIDGEGGSSSFPPLWTVDDATSEITGTSVATTVPLSLTASDQDTAALHLHPASGGTAQGTALIQFYDDTGAKVGDFDASGHMELYDIPTMSNLALDKTGFIIAQINMDTIPTPILFGIQTRNNPTAFGLKGVFFVLAPGSGSAVKIPGVEPGDVMFEVDAANGQTADLAQFWDPDYVDNTRFDKAARLVTRVHSAPADGDIAAGDCAMWFDQTDGAAKVMFKGKSADGTVVTGNLPLS